MMETVKRRPDGPRVRGFKGVMLMCPSNSLVKQERIKHRRFVSLTKKISRASVVTKPVVLGGEAGVGPFVVDGHHRVEVSRGSGFLVPCFFTPYLENEDIEVEAGDGWSDSLRRRHGEMSKPLVVDFVKRGKKMPPKSNIHTFGWRKDESDARDVPELPSFTIDDLRPIERKTVVVDLDLEDAAGLSRSDLLASLEAWGPLFEELQSHHVVLDKELLDALVEKGIDPVKFFSKYHFGSHEVFSDQEYGDRAGGNLSRIVLKKKLVSEPDGVDSSRGGFKKSSLAVVSPNPRVVEEFGERGVATVWQLEEKLGVGWEDWPRLSKAIYAVSNPSHISSFLRHPSF